MRNDGKLKKSSGRLKRLLISALLLTAVFSFGIQNPLAISKAEPQTHTVYIREFKFIPDTLTVNAGDTIVWKNEDKVPHTATAEEKIFDSKNIPNGASWKYVADKKGSHPYICTPHPNMKAILIVQ